MFIFNCILTIIVLKINYFDIVLMQTTLYLIDLFKINSLSSGLQESHKGTKQKWKNGCGFQDKKTVITRF